MLDESSWLPSPTNEPKKFKALYAKAFHIQTGLRNSAMKFSKLVHDEQITNNPIIITDQVSLFVQDLEYVVDVLRTTTRHIMLADKALMVGTQNMNTVFDPEDKEFWNKLSKEIVETCKAAGKHTVYIYRILLSPRLMDRGVVISNNRTVIMTYVLV